MFPPYLRIERVVVLLSEFPTALDPVSFPLDGRPVEVVVAVLIYRERKRGFKRSSGFKS